MGRILDKVNTVDDIRSFNMEQLSELCSEIREYMIECCSKNPGHLASSLGAVELIVGLHYIFNTPGDKIVFDVGHQAYAHKILTGRKEAFARCRTSGGISGFPRRYESEFDIFSTGHSSTSISAALGLAEATKIKGSDEKIVAFIGDGALSGGLAFEGLNNAGASNANLLIILNDNNQSIDRNLGGLHNHLLKLTTNPAFNRVKDEIWERMGETRTRHFFQRWSRSLKSWAVNKTGGDLFESLGFRYFGPINGNDIQEVTTALSKLRNMKGPRILHCYTIKGKGYAPAESNPTVWHAPGRFDPASGKRFPSTHRFDRFQDVFGQTLTDLAVMDKRVVGVTPAMASGCGMNILAKEMPDRFFDVGIEEEHAVTFSAGMAAGGLRPFCNLYSSFSQRAYDQIIHDIALQNLPVVICLDRAGLVGEDGATHHGALDLAAYRSVPGTTVCAPRNEWELRMAMYTGLSQDNGPFIIRYPRGMGSGADWKGTEFKYLEPGKGERLREGRNAAILTLGPLAIDAVAAAEKWEEETGYTAAVYDMRYLKPLDMKIINEVFSSFDNIVTVEDGCIKGGLFSSVCEIAASGKAGLNIKGIGIPDRYISHASQKEERHECGLDSDGILKELNLFVEKSHK